MPKKQVRFSEDHLKRLGKKGASEDDADAAFKKLLDQDDDINRALMCDEEPETEKLKILKKKWGKDKKIKELEQEIKRLKGEGNNAN